MYYRVQTGVFRKRENADRMLYQLQDQGYPAYILLEGDFYKVQVGAFCSWIMLFRWNSGCGMTGTDTLIVNKMSLAAKPKL